MDRLKEQTGDDPDFENVFLGIVIQKLFSAEKNVKKMSDYIF
ncbi:hypothetical protein AB670_01771 [Chryseobacterium sp. MOF25P]|nr:hypothetical protein [Chryseobacterium sp. MOF25P]OBW41956.1 hypothetical protein AB670_01771 [Chryseobacterium sp. MOF25P]OBW45037.1 hypothetical protein AB671_02766 [Chryseobacterium sp. BGARF1]